MPMMQSMSHTLNTEKNIKTCHAHITQIQIKMYDIYFWSLQLHIIRTLNYTEQGNYSKEV